MKKVMPREESLGLFGATLIIMALAYLTGCSGMEIGGKLGVYRVDERQESQKTYRHAVPLKCYFTACSDVIEEGEK